MKSGEFWYQQPCVVRTVSSGRGHSVQNTETYSISGILIGEKQGLVLTHGSVLAHLLKGHKSIYSDLGTLGYSVTGLGNIAFEVLLLGNRKQKDSSKVSFQTEPTKSYYTELLNCSQTNNTTKEPLHTFKGKTLCVFKCHKFQQALDQLLPVDSGWKLHDNSTNSKTDQAKDDIDKSMEKLLSCFVLIGLEPWMGGYNHPVAMVTGFDCRVGDVAEIVATPFGDLSAEVFMNSHSRGVVSNVSGQDNVLLLTDARCIPGSEGGALYLHSYDNKRYLLGMIVAPFCWKNTEWIGLTVACSLWDILSQLKGILASSHPKLEEISLDRLVEQRQAGMKVCSSVVLVRSGSTWGSGVLIDSNRGIILTCSHVVKWGSTPVALIKLQSVEKWYRAAIVHCTPEGDQFDMAVLRITDPLPAGLEAATVSSVPLNPGEEVRVTGHALFDEDTQLTPAVTSGVISKVTRLNQIPVMIQTTCAVHAGASGGAVTNTRGHLLGIVVCNAKDVSSGASFPHINLSVPLQTIWPVLEEYRKTQDPNILKALQITNKQVKTLWNLGNANKPSVDSKL